MLCGREQLVSQHMHDGAMCSSDVTILHLEDAAASSCMNISSMMMEAYHAIGDPDGIYGCNSDRHATAAARSVNDHL